MKRISFVINSASKLSYNVKNTHHIYKNPCLDLQRYLEIPLFKDNELYSPSVNCLLAAENLFIPKQGHKIGVISRAIRTDKFPAHDLPEVAFMGRSNAGKSSVLKAILKNVPDLTVRTSKKPGHTKSIQFFGVGQKLCLVDMPGYGHNQPEWFEPVVKNYLEKRKNLVKTFLITDGNVGIQDMDKATIKMFEDLRIPYCLIMTKIDKANDGQRLRNLLLLLKVKEEFKSVSCYPLPFMLSASTNEGLAYFLAFLGHITGNLSLNE